MKKVMLVTLITIQLMTSLSIASDNKKHATDFDYNETNCSDIKPIGYHTNDKGNKFPIYPQEYLNCVNSGSSKKDVIIIDVMGV